nr:probable disease resistance protein At1g59620 [Quercus suber]
MGISPVFSNLFHFYVLDLSIILIVLFLSAYFIIFLLNNNRSFQRLEKSFKQVSWEFKLLDALLEDVEAVSESGRKIDEKAHQLGSSQLRSVATIRLNDATRGWVDATKTVIRNVRDWRKTYEELSERRKSLKWIYFGFSGCKKIHGLQIDLDSCSSEINVQIWTIHREKICEFVESSRSTVRSLQDRPIEEDKRKPYQKPAKSASIEKKLKVLISKTPDLESVEKMKVEYSIKFPLQLLIAFLQDLEGLILESNIEEAWVEEAHDTIDEIQHDIDRKQEIPTLMSWLPYFGNWIRRRELMKSFYGMQCRLLRLFLRKQEFDFTFIRRYQSQSVHRSPQQQTQATTHEKDISAPLDDFSNQLKHAPPVATYQLKQLEKLFHQVHQSLKEANAVEGIENLKNSKTVWKDQMKTLIKAANNSLSTYIRNSTTKRSNTQSETDPWQKFSAELGEFQKALGLFESRIKLCRIELKEETNLEVGLEEDIHEIVTQLTTKRDRFSTHSIVGMKGIGKTTLAKMVLNNTNIQNHFKYRYLVSLPDSVDDDKNVLLKRLGNVLLTRTPEEGKEKDYSFKEVKDFLKVKKYLLVLDNIMRKETWDNLKEAFPDNKNESRILLTTRDKSVASHADPSCDPYRLRLRTKAESWDLFRQTVPQPQLSLDLKKLAEKVVRRCGGLPLSILSIGYLLSGKEVTTVEFSRVLEHINPYQTPWIDNWETNGKDLPPNLRECISHFAQFPKDSEISAKRLVALWVAEGFVPKSSDKPLESVARKNLKDLIECNMVQELERNHDGKILTCGLPSALQELCSRPDSTSSPDQRLPYYFVQMDTISSQRHGSSLNSRIILQKCRNLSSILFFDSREGDKPGKEIGDFLHMGIASGHLLHLEVLDLEHIFRPHLPRSIGRLTRLKYLGLRWTYLEEIPSSIGKLVNLQTLDLKHTYIHTLPGSIWKLQNLQNLYMNGIYRSKIAPQHRVGLVTAK